MSRWTVLRRYGWWVVFGLLAAVLVVALTRLSLSPTQPARPVVLASGSWEPFVGPDLPGDGPLARIVTEVLQREGFDPQVRFSSWDLADERTERGQVFGSFPWIGSQARQERYLLSDDLFTFRYALFYSQDAFPEPPQIDDRSDLEQLNVGIVSGYDVWDELEDAVDEFAEYPTAEAAFDALNRGDIDLLPEGLLPGRAIAEERAPRVQVVDQEGDGLLGATERLYFMMPRTPEAAEFMPRFNDALAEVKQTQLYADVEVALGSTSNVVELAPAAADELVVLLEHADADAPHLLAPPGTTALVLEWPAAFTTGPAGPADDDVFVEVRVLDGPARGRVVFVDARSIRLAAAGV